MRLLPVVALPLLPLLPPLPLLPLRCHLDLRQRRERSVDDVAAQGLGSQLGFWRAVRVVRRCPSCGYLLSSGGWPTGRRGHRGAAWRSTWR